ncbi:hypothetical protein P168DRAFT_243913 [Aspergillus campestris IBT 28561]|uniref:Trichothecene 3-O-acetyltransferase-like N-terminal domain-containing protein n=1 Tax=Aspergillus campestris (strain IBT 28561) TaxID=1392248 RepID=A0A2I1CS63_ASPC2|nr:uncharacterized protein P168DRAFT_243913 [Aspergillus campestris IBT 28561]PKY00459.1 hypothetical protein P168DRAFT_243913 [Aspergillus campestris IBT 28561]
MASFDHIRDILGQLPLLQSYTHILLTFSLKAEDRPATLEALEVAARQLVTIVPFLAGKVVNQGRVVGNSGVYTVAPHEPWTAPEHRIVHVQDHSDKLPSYEAMLAASGPTTMFPGSLLATRRAFPERYVESDEDPAPVIEIQANLVEGGLLLNIAAQHNIIDGNGIFQVANLLSTLFRHETIHPLELDEANRDRRVLIPLLGPDEPLLDHSELRPPAMRPMIFPSLANFQWACFRFPPVSSTTILTEANSRPADFPPGITSVSVNDAWTAFLWQRLTIIRLAQGDNYTPETISNLNRALDMRRVLGISPAYLGHMVRVVHTRLPMAELASSSLSKLAGLVRHRVVDENTLYAARSYATFLANEPNKENIAYGGAFNPRTDLSCSSMAHVQAPKFGPLGKPDMHRRPTFGPLPSVGYIAGEGKGGCLGVTLCLQEGEMMLLRQDERWGELVEYVG